MEKEDNCELLRSVRYMTSTLFIDEKIKTNHKKYKFDEEDSTVKFFENAFNCMMMELGADPERNAHNPRGFTLTMRLDKLIKLNLERNGEFSPTRTQICISKISDDDEAIVIDMALAVARALLSMNKIEVGIYRSGQQVYMKAEHVLVVWSIHSYFSIVDERSHLHM